MTLSLDALLADIDNPLCDVQMAGHDARNLAGLLDTLSGKGYANALAANDEWQQKWWEQAGYIARALERVAAELEASTEAAETSLYNIRGTTERESA